MSLENLPVSAIANSSIQFIVELWKYGPRKVKCVEVLKTIFDKYGRGIKCVDDGRKPEQHLPVENGVAADPDGGHLRHALHPLCAPPCHVSSSSSSC